MSASTMIGSLLGGAEGVAATSIAFIGGIMAVYMINAPLWFDILDLSVAYFPMAWLSTKSKFAKTA